MVKELSELMQRIPLFTRLIRYSSISFTNFVHTFKLIDLKVQVKKIDLHFLMTQKKKMTTALVTGSSRKTVDLVN